MVLEPLKVSTTTDSQMFGVLRALVLAWADRNGIPLASLASRMRYTGSLLDAFPSQEYEKVVREQNGGMAWANLKELEQSFESLLTKEVRRKQGAVYTPPAITRYLVSESTLLLGRKPTSFCDPACGAGAFLLEAAGQLIEGGHDPLEVVCQSVVGVDCNPNALHCAAILLELLLLQHNGTALDHGLNLHLQDTLIAGSEGLRLLAPNSAGFDILATNPPYVKLQTLDAEYRALLAQKYAHLVKGSFSLAPLFLHVKSEAHVPGGVAAVITQNNFFTSLSGEPIRRYLQSGQRLRKLIDFGHQHVFPNASAYACLVFTSDIQASSFEYGLLDKTPTFESLRQLPLVEMKYSSLNPKKWRLGNPDAIRHLHQIESAGVPLGVAFDVRVGFATLKDKVFLLDRQNEEQLTVPDWTGHIHNIERGLTRPAIKIADLSGQRSPSEAERFVIFPYEKVGARYTPIAEGVLQEMFPLGYAYLLAQRPVLETRSGSDEGAVPWYAWGRSQGMSAPGPKLLTKTFDRGPHFYWDASDSLFCNGYAISPRRTPILGAPSLPTLQALLNSSVMHYYSILTSFQIAGGYQCYQKNFIVRFGLPTISPTTEAQLREGSLEERDAIVASLYGIPLSTIRDHIEAYQDRP